MSISTNLIPAPIYLNNPSLESIRNECLQCKKALQPHYKLYGGAVHGTLPYSISWIATTALLYISKAFAERYTFQLGRQFVLLTQNNFLKEVNTRFTSAGLIALHPLKPNGSVSLFSMGVNRDIYIKLEEFDAKARAPLEMMVWKCATILGLEDYFSPTSKINGVGGFQLAVSGKSLAELNAVGYIGPTKEQTVSGFMINYFFGFTDANCNNLFFDESNHMRFIDVVRSFPHSNDILLRDVAAGEQLVASFRFGLVTCSEYYNPLTREDWQLIETFVTLFNDNLELIKKEIKALDLIVVSDENDPEHPKKIPKEWVNIDLMIKALDERMQKLTQIVQGKSVKTLRDLLFTAFPKQRFLAALTLAQQHRRDEISVEILQKIKEADALFKELEEDIPLEDVCRNIREFIESDYKTPTESAAFRSIHQSIEILPNPDDYPALAPLWKAVRKFDEDYQKEHEAVIICETISEFHENDYQNAADVDRALMRTKLQKLAFEGICGLGYDLPGILSGFTKIDVERLYELSLDLAIPFDAIIDAIILAPDVTKRNDDQPLKIYNELKKGVERDEKT